MSNKKKSVVLFGDSLLGCFGKSLINNLENKSGEVIVYNCAAGGLNTDDGVKQTSFIAKLEPDNVVLSFGANDCAPWKGKPVKPENFEKNIERIIRAFPKSQVIFFPCPPVDVPNQPEETKEFNNDLHKYNLIARDVVEKIGAKYIDSARVYGALLKAGKDYHEEDGVHLNEKGYDLLLEEIVKLLDE